VSAVAQITGRGDVFLPLSNRELSADDLERVLRDLVETTGVRVIFTDLPAGSCTIAARRLLRGRPDLVLVTGANVAALLDFVFHGEHQLPDEQAAGHAADKGRASVLVVAGSAAPAAGGMPDRSRGGGDAH
jgi:PTS system N-acetylgalactosamine-specific IIA component